MTTHARNLATINDLLAIPEADRFHEIIDGALVEKAAPGGEHGVAQLKLGELLGPYNRKGGPRGPGGWWVATETEIEFEAHEVFRPDIAGWKRERVPERPTGFPIRIRPDWVCEVLSDSDRNRDLVKKFRAYQRFGVKHYWIVDPSSESLTVHRWMKDGYLVVISAGADETVRAEPFEAVELQVGELFGHEPS